MVRIIPTSLDSKDAFPMISLMLRANDAQQQERLALGRTTDAMPASAKILLFNLSKDIPSLL
ncbi:MAG: hypothetical protein LBQ43_03060 [Holosporales bacterium]|nr:hypothetical protein [Holosporales bacterium]